MQLFTATIDANNEACVNLPGFSHWGQPRRHGARTGLVRTIHFFAKHRTEAARQLGSIVGIFGPCDLSEGRRCDALLPSRLRRI